VARQRIKYCEAPNDKAARQRIKYCEAPNDKAARQRIKYREEADDKTVRSKQTIVKRRTFSPPFLKAKKHLDET